MWTAVGSCLLVALAGLSGYEAVQDDWAATEAAYEDAVAARAQAWAAQMRADPDKAPPPSPVPKFWGRFEALAGDGEGRAVAWLLRHLDEAPKGERPRGDVLAGLFAQVENGQDEEWVVDALQPLVAARAELADPDALVALLGALAADERPEEVRRAARLGLAEVLTGSDPELALRLRLDAFAEGSQHFDPADLSPAERDELAERVEDALWDAKSAHLERWFTETDDGYFGKPGAPPEPEESHRPVLEALAERGSPIASVWVLTNTWGQDESTKNQLRTALEVVASEEAGGKHVGSLVWHVDSLVGQLGLDFVEPKVQALLAKAEPEDSARLAFSLGVGVCESAGEDAEQLERGLGILRELVAQQPDTDAARDAAGKIFRFSKLGIGQPAPDFEAADVDGNAFKLSDYKGKVTVIDFWGFW